MNRATAKKLAELCEGVKWRNTLQLLARIPAAESLEHAVSILHECVTLERKAAEARKLAGMPVAPDEASPRIVLSWDPDAGGDEQ